MARRRRKDPDEAPIDGDPTFDTLINRDPSKAYRMVSVDDMPRMVNRGFTRTIAQEGGVKVPYGIQSADGSEIVVNGQLVVMEAPKEVADAVQRKGEQEFARRTKGLHDSIRDHVRNNPGSEFRSKQNYATAG